MQLPAHIPVLSMRWNCSEPLSTVFPEDIAKYFRHFFPGFLALPAIQDYQIRHTGFPAWLAIRWPLATQDPAPLMHSQHLWDAHLPIQQLICLTALENSSSGAILHMVSCKPVVSNGSSVWWRFCYLHMPWWHYIVHHWWILHLPVHKHFMINQMQHSD